MLPVALLPPLPVFSDFHTLRKHQMSEACFQPAFCACIYIYGFYWRQNSVAVHDPWTRTFHGVTPPRPPTRQLPCPPMPVWIWRNVPWRKPKLWFLQPNMPVTMRWWWWWWWCFLFCFFFLIWEDCGFFLDCFYSNNFHFLSNGNNMIVTHSYFCVLINNVYCSFGCVVLSFSDWHSIF